MELKVVKSIIKTKYYWVLFVVLTVQNFVGCGESLTQSDDWLNASIRIMVYTKINQGSQYIDVPLENALVTLDYYSEEDDEWLEIESSRTNKLGEVLFSYPQIFVVYAGGDDHVYRAGISLEGFLDKEIQAIKPTYEDNDVYLEVELIKE